MACKRWTAISSLLATILIANTGCVIGSGANLGPLAFPIPVSPYFQKIKEDEAWIEERYMRVPILGPLTQGGPVVALDPPSDDEVIRAWERANPQQGGVPLLYEVQRNNVQIVKEKIADYVDPPRHVPLIGPAQLHHAHYKCTVYYTQYKRIGWPIPHTIIDSDATEVLYIDHNHFHMVGDVDGGVTAPF